MGFLFLNSRRRIREFGDCILIFRICKRSIGHICFIVLFCCQIRHLFLCFRLFKGNLGIGNITAQFLPNRIDTLFGKSVNWFSLRYFLSLAYQNFFYHQVSGRRGGRTGTAGASHPLKNASALSPGKAVRASSCVGAQIQIKCLLRCPYRHIAAFFQTHGQFSILRLHFPVGNFIAVSICSQEADSTANSQHQADACSNPYPFLFIHVCSPSLWHSRAAETGAAGLAGISLRIFSGHLHEIRESLLSVFFSFCHIPGRFLCQGGS